MAKKNFKSGLGDLLSDALDMPKEEVTVPKKRTTRKTTSKKKVTKSFMSDLDGFLQDAIEEGVQEQAAKLKKGRTKVASKRKKPLFGLDALIRETVETSRVEITPQSTKRITFIFDEEKNDKLQKIARLKKAYVKDIINEIVSEYIEQVNVTD
jgi:predicted metal-dependent hydrolase